MKLRINIVDSFDNSLARILEITHPKGSFETPTYAVSTNYIDENILEGASLNGVVEIPVLISIKKLRRAINDIRFMERIENKIKRLINKTPKNSMIISLPLLEETRDIEPKISEPQELNMLTQYFAEISCHPEATVVCSPIFHKVPEQFYNHIIDKFMETALSLNVYVAPSLPYASRTTLNELINIYRKWWKKEDKISRNLLCVDYNNSNAVTKYSFHNYVLTVKMLLEKEFEEPIAIYGVNVNYSRVKVKYEKISARDLFSYFIGLDVMGVNHKRIPLPSEVVERIKRKDETKSYKLLNRYEYMYVDIKDLLNKEIIASYKDHLKKILEKNEKIDDNIKKINIKIILEETDYLRKEIFKRSGAKHPLRYLEEKEGWKKDENAANAVLKITKRYIEKTKTLDIYKT